MSASLQDPEPDIGREQGSVDEQMPPLNPDLAFWTDVQQTLSPDDQPSIITKDVANQIIVLLQNSCKQRIVTSEQQIQTLADQLKLISLEHDGLYKLHSLMLTMETTLRELLPTNQQVPIVKISIIKQRIIFWRNVSKNVVSAFIAVAIINAIVPIEFALIAQGLLAVSVKAVAAVGSAVGTALSGPVAVAPTIAATDAAAAVAAATLSGPSMASIIMQSMQAVATGALLAAITALGNCGSAAVSMAVSAARAVCNNATMPNAEMIAEFAAQAAIFKAAVNASKSSYQFLTDFNNGVYDDRIEYIIRAGGYADQFKNQLVDIFFEQIDTMREAQVNIVLPGTKQVGIFDNQLDPAINRYIAEHFSAKIEDVPGIKSKIMSDLYAHLNDKTAPNYAANVVKMVRNYGPIVMLYDLYSENPSKIKKALSLPGLSSSKAAPLSPSSVTLPDSYRFPVGLHDFVIRAETKQLKQKILKDVNYRGAEPFKYIPDFQGSIDSYVKKVLSQFFVLNDPARGNIYTNIMINDINLNKQKKIYDYILSMRRTLSGNDQASDDVIINNTTAEVRTMINPSSAAPASSLFSMATGSKAAPSSAVPSLFSMATGSKATGFSGKPKLKSVEADADITGKKHPRGGRKSRHYKKKRTTLKRRRIRRRSTRKGKKMRHTKRR